MSKSDSTTSGFAYKPEKPNKPYPDYPLFPHAVGQWAKKVRGRMHYFGGWADPDAALKKYTEQKDALHAGRKPRDATEGVTVKLLCNAYLNHKRAALDAAQLSPRTFTGYQETAELIVAQFGKGRLVADLRPDDFAGLMKTMTAAKKWGPVRVRNYVQQVRSVFKYGLDADLLDRAVNFGPGFARPSKKTLRLERAKKGPQMYEATEVRALVGGKAGVTPSVALKAMILLGVNCGFGNADCGTLPLSALDLAGGWVNYHRPKTGITRRCPLWPETVAALKDVLAARKEPKDAADAGLVFVTAAGGSWHKDTSDTPISNEMRKLLKGLGIGGKRNFYALRHTFETVGGEAKDQVAVDHIMGHARDDMASAYRERISDARLKAVTDHVRAWVFGSEGQESPSERHPV